MGCVGRGASGPRAGQGLEVVLGRGAWGRRLGGRGEQGMAGLRVGRMRVGVGSCAGGWGVG